MITIECRCVHFRHREYVRKIVLYVIAGLIEPYTWIPCTKCGKVAFWIDEYEGVGLQLRVVEGGKR